jgi:hypothetical protein
MHRWACGYNRIQDILASSGSIFIINRYLLFCNIASKCLNSYEAPVAEVDAAEGPVWEEYMPLR